MTRATRRSAAILMVLVACAAFASAQDSTECTQPGCTSCPNDVTLCQTCAPGYFLFDFTCTPCTEIIESGDTGCQACSFKDESQQFTCDVALPGFFIASNGRIFACNVVSDFGGQANCATCTYADNQFTCTTFTDNGNGGTDNGNGGTDNGNGGTDNGNGGTDNGNGGTDNGGTDNGGTDNGGTDNGGTDNGGTDNGNNGGQTPSSCSDSQYLDVNANSCLACTTIDPNCGRCELRNTVPFCSTCQVGYYLAWYNYCASCSERFPNCAECTRVDFDPPTCKRCTNGYLPDSEGKCSPCPSTNTGCASCTTNSDGTTVCAECRSDYYLTSEGTCTSCASVDPYCVKCSTDGCTDACEAVCEQCAVGYTVYIQEKSERQCALCSDLVTNCADCAQSEDGEAFCTTCKNSYYLAWDGECVACNTIDEDCKQCSNSPAGPICTSCGKGQYADENNKCKPCSDFDIKCAECRYNFDKKAPVCTDCQYGFTLKDDLCIFSFTLSSASIAFQALILAVLLAVAALA